MVENQIKYHFNKNHDYTIDLLKFICALLVVFLHCQWKYSRLFLPFTRCAVPCFFMISGFLLFKDGEIDTERFKRNFTHVLNIILAATLLFFVWDELISYFSTRTFYVPTLKKINDWIVFNDCPFGFHLWYLYAYIYVLLIVMFFKEKGMLRYLFYSVPLLLLVDVFLGKYGMAIFSIDVPVPYLRNFLFVGLPYFCLGMLIRKYRKSFKLGRIILLGGVILFTITSYIERDILIALNAVASRDHYLSTTFLAISLFLLVTSFNISRDNTLTKIGKTDSLFIYILHPIILGICGIIALRIGLVQAYSYIAPFFCFFLTMFVIRVLKVVKIIK